MAATTAIAIGVGTSIYSAVDANQQRQKAKGQTAALLASRPDAASDQIKANQAALDAQQKARQKALGLAGRSSTILTGPQGVTSAPPATKSLLGL